ncbi:MAG: 3-deoxy-7-phosphoheptulonate synthase class II [Actinomycetota bacterium]|nr:3-deoxy-7-phosphoheptulonate synthase class II [Actinomycetota bacterium]
MTSVWTPGRWRELPAAQQPDWPDPFVLDQTLKTLSSLPPLVFAGEARSLRKALGEVAAGEAFLLQAGDCAESFYDFTADAIRDKLKVILQMAVVLTYGAGVPVLKLGRIAGQFAKPRSASTEVVDGVTLPSFRGHLVNDDAPTLEARTPDPQRLLAAYHQAASTLNLLRAFTKGGYADLSQIHTWNQEFVASSLQGKRYEAIAGEIERALRFMRACGIDLVSEQTLHQVDFWTSHEALILGWEEAMTRRDSLSGLWYDTSAHLLWVGERTREIEGAHVDFLSGIANPLGAKIGPYATAEEVVALCELLDPDRQPGRLTLVARMGAERVTEVLPGLLSAVRTSGHPVIWQCDPMHGNTVVGPGGRKTRHFDAVLTEIKAFFEVCRASGVWPGGMHVELTGDDVTECLGGAEEILADQLSLRYTTTCDPRLNGRQSLDLAFQVAELLRH